MTVSEARAALPEVLDRVADGEEITEQYAEELIAAIRAGRDGR